MGVCVCMRENVRERTYFVTFLQICDCIQRFFYVYFSEIEVNMTKKKMPSERKKKFGCNQRNIMLVIINLQLATKHCTLKWANNAVSFINIETCIVYCIWNAIWNANKYDTNMNEYKGM